MLELFSKYDTLESHKIEDRRPIRMQENFLDPSRIWISKFYHFGLIRGTAFDFTI